MNIASVDYNHETNAVEVYVSGCTLHCKGCHNEELKAFNVGRVWRHSIDKIISMHEVGRVMIFGGEPLDQDKESLKEMLHILGMWFNEVWLFTGYAMVPKDIRCLLTHMKVGAYMSKLPSIDVEIDGLTITLASCNQDIIKL